MKLDRFRWIGKDVKKEKPDVLWVAGDFDSFDSVGTHDANSSLKGRRKPTLDDELDASQRAHDVLASSAGGGFEKRYSRGNHEFRLERYVNDNPEMDGTVKTQHDHILGYMEWKTYEYGEICYVDRVGFTHMPFTIMGRPYGGKTANYRIAADSSCDLVYGHDHRANVSRIPRIGGGHNTAVGVGCSLPWGYVEPYAKHATTGWWWGVVVLDIRKGKIVSWNFKDMRSLSGA